jgi:serine/threonine protein phosphatase PrpC
MDMRPPLPPHSAFPNGRAAAYHDNSCHGEDAFLTRELTHHLALDAVLDGATGRGGWEASSYAAEILGTANIESVDDLTAMLDEINRELFRRGRGRFFLTTISAALKVGQELHVLSVGDSPVLLIRHGDIIPLTPAAKSQPFLGMANALGRHEKLSYKTASVSLQVQDRVVLVTDGVIENVAPSELATLLGHASSPEEAVSAVRQLLAEKQRENKGRVDDRSSFRRDDATALIRYVGLSDRPET